jgi:flagellar assembly protein FliH
MKSVATIIRSAERTGTDRGAAFNFDDMALQANRYLDETRQQAEAILAAARNEAARIRTRAESEGLRTAQQTAEQILESRMAATLLPAFNKLAQEIAQAKDAWIAQWERQLVHLASAIAAKVIRREIQQLPEITLELVRESLALAAGSPHLRVRLNQKDYEMLSQQVEQLVAHLGTVGHAQVVADSTISPGGCRVDTDFGVIDQQIESQLARIVEELT